MISLRLTSEINMRLEELSAKELAILELLDNGNYIGIKSICEKEIAEKREALRKRQKEMEEGKRNQNLEKKQQEIKETETKILEAICDKGCRNIQSISDVTEIHYLKVWKIVDKANLLDDLRGMEKKEDYEKVKNNYRKGMKINELVKITELSYYRTSTHLRKIKKEEKELLKEKENLLGIINQRILKRAQKEDSAFYYALLHVNRPWGQKKNFKKIYQRAKDIYDGYPLSECIKKWNVGGRQAASQFIDRVGMREIYRKKINERRLERKNLARILQQVILKRAQKEDPAFYYAYAYYIKPWKRLSFQKLYERTKDICDGYTLSECKRRWGITYVGALFFMENIGMGEIHRKKEKLLEK